MRAGYGIFWGENDQRNECRALRGKRPTAQRAEVSTLWRALDRTTQKITVISDSKYTVDTANGILKGHVLEHKGQHRDIWNKIIKLSHKLQSIQWVKAHTTPEQAESRGISPEDRE